MSDPVQVAMIGLGFGAEFIPIYQAHPNANVAAVCRRNETELNAVEHGDADAEDMPCPTFFLRTVGHGGPEPIQSHQRSLQTSQGTFNHGLPGCLGVRLVSFEFAL